jgi:hypothetical protein
MKDQKTMFMMVSALMLALAAMLAGPAGARPIDVDGTPGSSKVLNLRPDDKGGLQGIGAVGEAVSVMPYAGFVVPYLSQGQGVDKSQFGGVQTPQSNSGWYTGLEHADMPNATVAPDSDDFAWREVTIGGGAAIAALLLAGMALLYTRGRHGKLAT